MGKASRERRRRREEAAGRPVGARPASGGATSGRPSASGGRAFGLGGPSAPDLTAVWQAAIQDAVWALAHGDRWRFDASVALLLTPRGADERAHVRRVEQLVREQLLASLTQAWQRGWQPADVLRYGRRRLDAGRLDVLGGAVVTELRRYPADTVDPRWSQQLDEAEVRPWSPEQTFLSAAIASWRGGWPEVLEAALETLWLTTTLGTLPVIGPLPGAGRIAPAPKPRDDLDERLLTKVRMLLAKAESTTFPAEAETFTAAAQSLMARHSIDAALLAASAGPAGRSGVQSVRIGVDNPYEGAKMALLQAVVDANRCSTVWFKDYGFASVVGFRADLDSVELLFTSLLVQATTALAGAGSNAQAGARSRSRSFRQSFLLSFALRIGERLKEATASETERASHESGGSALLPVLASRAEAVQEAVEDMFPHTHSTRLGSANDAAGWASGREAADRASLTAGRPVRSAG